MSALCCASQAVASAAMFGGACFTKLMSAGVDMPNRREFVAHNLNEDEVCEVLGADGLLYQTVEDLIATGHELNANITTFEDSCFTCKYVTGDVDAMYLDDLERAGRGKMRTRSGKLETEPELATSL